MHMLHQVVNLNGMLSARKGPKLKPFIWTPHLSTSDHPGHFWEEIKLFQMPAGFIKWQQIPDLKVLLVSSCSPWMNLFFQDAWDFLDFPHAEQKYHNRDKPYYFFLFLLPPESKDNLSSSH